MDKLIILGVATILALAVCVFMGLSLWGKVKATNLPFRYDRRIYSAGLMISSFLAFEATLVIFVYHLSWIYYVFVALFVICASLLISFAARRVYKRSHPNEPTDIKRPTFREAYRATNGNIDGVSLIFALGFFLVVIASMVFHQPVIFSLAIPLLIGPWAIYKGVKMLHEAQEGHQSDSIHWYTQYRILFGISAILSFPNALILNNGPLAFVQNEPYHDQIEIVLLLLYVIPLLASGFFFFRRQYLKMRGRIS